MLTPGGLDSERDVWIQRLRLLARTRTRQFGVARHSEAMSDESVTELQGGELLNSTQCEAGVTVVAGGFSRHGFAFRAAIRELGI
eukprot:6180574-Pleurochrysis_carterae.AAC.1